MKEAELIIQAIKNGNVEAFEKAFQNLSLEIFNEIFSFLEEFINQVEKTDQKIYQYYCMFAKILVSCNQEEQKLTFLSHKNYFVLELLCANTSHLRLSEDEKFTLIKNIYRIIEQKKLYKEDVVLSLLQFLVSIKITNKTIQDYQVFIKSIYNTLSTLDNPHLTHNKDINDNLSTLKHILDSQLVYCQHQCRTIFAEIGKFTTYLNRIPRLHTILLNTGDYSNSLSTLSRTYNAVAKAPIASLSLVEIYSFYSCLINHIRLIVANLVNDSSLQEKATLLINIFCKEPLFKWGCYNGSLMYKSIGFSERSSDLLMSLKNLLDEIKTQITKANKQLNSTQLTSAEQSLMVITHGIHNLTVGYQKSEKGITFVKHPLQEKKEILLEQRSPLEKRKQAALFLAKHYFDKSQKLQEISSSLTPNCESTALSTQVKYYSTRLEKINCLIQAGIYIECYLAITSSYKTISDTYDAHKHVDANGSYGQINFYNIELQDKVYDLTEIVKIFPIDNLLQMRNTAIEISILQHYLEGKCKLSHPQYLYLARQYPALVAEHARVSTLNHLSLDRYHLSLLSQVKEILIGKIRAHIHSAYNPEQKENLFKAYEVISQIAINPTSINDATDKNIEAQRAWLEWAFYNKNKIREATQQPENIELERFIKKHNENPLTAMEISNNNEIESLTFETCTKQYRKLALKYHPDKIINQPDEYKKASAEKWQKVQDAYQLLSIPNLLSITKESFKNKTSINIQVSSSSFSHSHQHINLINELSAINNKTFKNEDAQAAALTFIKNNINHINSFTQIKETLEHLRFNHALYPKIVTSIRIKDKIHPYFYDNGEDNKIECSKAWQKILSLLSEKLNELIFSEHEEYLMSSLQEQSINPLAHKSNIFFKLHYRFVDTLLLQGDRNLQLQDFKTIYTSLINRSPQTSFLTTLEHIKDALLPENLEYLYFKKRKKLFSLTENQLKIQCKIYQHFIENLKNNPLFNSMGFSTSRHKAIQKFLIGQPVNNNTTTPSVEKNYLS